LLARVGARLVDTDWARVDAGEAPRYFPLVETSVRLALSQDRQSLAERLARVLREMATRAGDEVMTLKALRVLCGLGGGQRVEAQVAALERGCDYRLVRHQTSKPPRPIAAENVRQYQALASAVRRATGAVGSPDLEPALRY
jgi:hypothetical protein